jgi:hypothetical protein
MKLKQKLKRWRMKKTLLNNAGRIATVAAAFAGVAIGIHGWRSRAH